MPRKPILFILTNNHFDPTWRRCWDRRFTFQGKTYVSYADIEEWYLLENLELARKHRAYKFEAESTVVVRKFLERHPARLAELQRLAAEGRFAVSGAGDNIIDTNMVLGESIVRNYLLGLLWVEEHLGQKTLMGVRNDGFGNSAQLPQIIRGCEIDWVTGFSYSPLNGNYWRGLDGSTICSATPPMLASGGGCEKYPPCPKCQGAGCRACGGRGIELKIRCILPTGIDEKKLRKAGVGIVKLCPEENLPNPDVFTWVRALQKRFDVRFAVESDLQPFVKAQLARVDRPPASELHPGVELNANNSGCLVTRIKLKQVCRRQEHALLGAETLATIAALRGASYPREGLREVWRTLLFTQFHDAITATHVDPAYDELCDMQREIDAGTVAVREMALRSLATDERGVFSVVNASGLPASALVTATVRASKGGVELRDDTGRRVPVLSSKPTGKGNMEITFLAGGLAALSTKTYQTKPGKRTPAPKSLAKPIIENARFRVTGDEHGLTAIYDKRLRKTIAQADVYRPNELILERDEGSPWATLHPDCTREALSPKTRLVSAERGDGWQRLTYGLDHTGRFLGSGHPLNFRTHVYLYEGAERVEFRTEVHWDSHNCRLRVAMPAPIRGRAVYGIPYGQLGRGSYTPSYHWAGANGDWPAIHWAGVESRGLSVALFDKGLPSYGVERSKGSSTILLSVLRSPAIPTYLHEPDYYSMTAFDGMRDAGNHVLEYALTAYAEKFSGNTVEADASSYNAGLLTVSGRVDVSGTPRVTSSNVRLAALKCSEQGDALIVRLAEYRGRAGVANVSIPDGFRRVERVNLLERNGTRVPTEGRVSKVMLRAWEIATLRLER